MTEDYRVQEPLLAIVFSSRSRPWTELVEAGAGLCRFLWIVDSREPDIGDTLKVLRRFGKVIDTAGCTPEIVIQRIHGEHPDGITSFFDTDLHRQAWMAAALGLASPSVRATARLTDKLLQREALEAAGVPGPRFSAVNESVDGSEIERLCEALRFPMVI